MGAIKRAGGQMAARVPHLKMTAVEITEGAPQLRRFSGFQTVLKVVCDIPAAKRLDPCATEEIVNDLRVVLESGRESLRVKRFELDVERAQPLGLALDLILQLGVPQGRANTKDEGIRSRAPCAVYERVDGVLDLGSRKTLVSLRLPDLVASGGSPHVDVDTFLGLAPTTAESGVTRVAPLGR